MAIVSKDVTIDGIQLTRYSSDKDVKIKCVQDGIIYPIAYLTRGSSVEFSETNIPLNEISSGAIVSYGDVMGLSGYISSVVDFITDDKPNNGINFDLGGA